MIDTKRELFQRIGRLDTWIVGIQYYSGAGDAAQNEVVLERDPDNPFDPNAIAAYTVDGIQVGHLPRYDAVYFSPLILDGVIALKGRAGSSDLGDRLPIAIEVFATAKVSELLICDPRDDWRAMYHNVFVELWERLPKYSSATLLEFRDRFRPLAHDQPLYPKTLFLYRMLKAHIADLENQERVRLQAQVVASVQGMSFGPFMGWPELTVIPLDASGTVSPAEIISACKDDGCTALAKAHSHLPDVLRLLPLRCSYPAGAHGAVVLVHGTWLSLDWFDSAECAQVYWYQMILSCIERALRETPREIAPVEVLSEATKARILQALQQSDCSLAGADEAQGGMRVDITAGDRVGYAIYRDSELIRLHMGEHKTEAAYDAPVASKASRHQMLK